MKTLNHILLSLTCLTLFAKVAIAEPTVVPQIGHSAPINHLTYSPSGRFLSSASEDSTLRIWAEDGNIIAVLAGHKAPVVQSVFLSDQHLLSIDRTGILLGWNTLSETKTVVADFNGIVPVMGKDVMGLAQDTSHLAVAGYRSFHWTKLADNWRPNSTIKFNEVRVGFDIDAISVSPSGRYIAAANKLGDVFIYDTNRKAKLFGEMLDPVFTRIQFINDEFLALAGRDISLFNLERQRIVNTIGASDRFKTVQALDIDPTDGDIAAITDKLQLFDAKTKQPVLAVDDVADAALAYSADGSRIAVVDSSSATTCLADRTRIRILGSDGTELARFAPGFNAAPISALSSGGRLAISACSQQVQVWDMQKRKLQQSIKGLEAKVRHLYFDAAGERIFVLDAAGRMESFSGTDGKDQERIKTGLKSGKISFSSNTGVFAYAQRNDEGLAEVHIETINGSEKAFTLPKSFTSEVEKIQFSPSGSMVTVRTEDDAIVAFSTKAEAAADSGASSTLGRIGLDGSRIVDYAFNPASEQVVVAYDTRLELWSSQSFDKLNMVQAKYSGIQKLRFSDDGEQFALITHRKVVLYKASDLSVVHEIDAGTATDAHFSEDSKTLIIVNRDAGIDIYDLQDAPSLTATVQNINDQYGYALDGNGQLLSVASEKVVQPLLRKVVDGDQLRLRVVGPEKASERKSNKANSD